MTTVAMKMVRVVLCLSALALAWAQEEEGGGTNPISKVLEMIDDLQKKIIKEGEESHKVFAEYSEWCSDNARQYSENIKTAAAEVKELSAHIEKESANIETLNTKIEELAAEITTDTADLKAATEIRDQELAVFVAEEKELVQTIDTLKRAIAILEREMAKIGGASMLQLKNAKSITEALTAMVQASLISSTDSSKLTGLLQEMREAQAPDDDDDSGAPAGSVYEGHSDGIIETLQDLLDKAEKQLDGLRRSETTSKNNYEVLKQSLDDQIRFANEEMDEAKKALAASTGSKAEAEGDMEATTKDLSADKEAKATLHSDCMEKAEDFEAEVKSRAEELKAIAEAEKILKEFTGGATEQTYSFVQVSFAQVASSTSEESSGAQAVRYVRELASRTNSTSLAQLAMRMASAIRVSAKSGADPFAKVKGLITQMIATLEEEARQDAAKKAYCDRELSHNEEKEQDKMDEIEKLTTEIDKASTQSAHLKEEVAGLQKALAALAKSQKDMDKLREQEKGIYDRNRPEMEKGLEGVKMALKVLRDYYSKDDKDHAANEGAGGGIIGMLEVVESDFSKGLAEMISTEEAAAAEYDSETKANEIDKDNKEQDVKYKVQESNDLDKAVAEAKADRAGVQKELDAVQAVLKTLHDECDEKVEPYEEQQRRRAAEIEGLKNGLQILEGQAVLLQTSSRRLRTHRAA